MEERGRPRTVTLFLASLWWYHRPADTHAATMNTARFEVLVQKALDSLPEEFASLLDNVMITVEPRPSHGLLRELGLRGGETLFGLYEGIPQTERTTQYGLVPPDRIILFQQPIEESASSEEEVEEQVYMTLLHEIAHHFGIDDRRLREIERESRRKRGRH